MLGNIANILARRGEVDEALTIYQDKVLPTLDRLGDVHGRAVIERATIMPASPISSSCAAISVMHCIRYATR